jgi:outer membrane protein OmpA-like peptidoglycan-associated protein
MVVIFKEYPRANFTIEGHTDSVGSKATNQKLSERRANAVRDYLIANGIDANRLTAAGYGEDKPIASNATRAGRAENRRVEVNLVKSED